MPMRLDSPVDSAPGTAGGNGTNAAAQVVLVTGASSGIGLAICELLSKSGHVVYGASRSESGAEGWTELRMDVTSKESVEAAVQETVRREGRLDALVCCAGAGLVGSVEDTSIEEAQRHFDTNFFGTTRVIGAVLPVMRQARAGRIIVIGSIGGLIGLPFLGHYSATKFALDGLVEALRSEIAPFGVQASIVHPGNFNTPLGVSRISSADSGPRSPYWSVFARMRNFYAAEERDAPPPDAVARKVAKMLTMRSLPVRAVVGSPLEALGVWGRAMLPSRAFEYIFRRVYGPDRL